nr:MAG TPA: hypothetical protein [Caudoviricetes sp.]
MKISCPHCGQHYELDTPEKDFCVSCTNCGKKFKVVAPLSGGKKVSSGIANVFSSFFSWCGLVATRTKSKYAKKREELESDIEKLNGSIIELNRKIAGRKNLLLNTEEEITLIRQQLAAVMEANAISEVAFYEPHYSFDKPVDFERAIKENRAAQKDFLQADGVLDDSHVGSGTKRQRNALKKLMLAAFNAQCDLCITNVTYKNIVQYESRIEKSGKDINDMAQKVVPDTWNIPKKLIRLKIDELRLSYEYAEKKQQAAEEQRRINEIMREEIRAEREMERAKAEAKKEQDKFEELLRRAVAQAERAQGEELERMNAQIALLRQQLDDVKEKERKISEAQKTKAGYVYVISNIGSFGENVYKIGMTRRLEPQERIDELGDASVPFSFDVHAMIWSENAPELENRMHREFESRRLNKINSRKEFFRVDLDEVEAIAKKYKADVEFTKLAEAKEYRQSLAIQEHASAAVDE